MNHKNYARRANRNRTINGSRPERASREPLEGRSQRSCSTSSAYKLSSSSLNLWQSALYSPIPPLSLKLHFNLKSFNIFTKLNEMNPLHAFANSSEASGVARNYVKDLEVGEVTVFVEGADEASARPRPTNPVYDGTRPTPPYAVVCEAFPREPTWCPALPPATHAPRGWANSDLSPPLSRTRGAHHRGQVLWQECPGTPLLLLVVATRGDPGRILGITPTHL